MFSPRFLKTTYFPAVRRKFHRNAIIWCNKVNPKNSLAMKVLNVAEKNDAAKNLAGYLSGGNLRRREGFSKFNKIYEFDCSVFNQRCQMTMTSVSGHLLGLDFVGSYKKWRGCSPLTLFDAPVCKSCPQDYLPIKRTIEREVKQCGTLIIWTDCDREGENIGFEIIQICLAVKQNLRIYRAKFSEITAPSAYRALQTLAEPNKNISDAVDVRQELDLRIGAAFTRFQTLRLTHVFPQNLSDSLISYGSCQFPTLGFVVDRFNQIRNFIPEQFWKIKVIHTMEELSVDFRWKRIHLFDQLSCQVLYDKCIDDPLARVENVQSKPKSKWRPLPLDTVEMEKLGSRKLKINAKEMMKIAEKLYSQGFISYPRTETNIFPKELNLRNLIEQQTQDHMWGEFANRVLQDGPNPRAGKKSDEAHPPIHPTKYTNSLHGNEKKVYEFVVRHFLACCSKDAEGMETIVDIDIAGEKFVANGLMIIARNYLDVYPYEKWNAKEIHIYQPRQTFDPTSIDMVDGETSAPKLLTEADLISLMEKHGIGTDATHAEHIEKIKSRMYVGLQDGCHFVPGELGMGLVEGYDSMGFPMSKPNLRADLEAELKKVCEGTKDPKVVLAEQLAKYKEVFQLALQQAEKLDQALGKYLQETAQIPQEIPVEEQPTSQPVLKCPSCGLDMILRSKRESSEKFISCMGYPDCRNALWFPGNVENVELSGEFCAVCGPSVQKLNFKFRHHSFFPYYEDNHTGCVGGCDEELLEMLDIRLNSVRPNRNTNTNNNAGAMVRGAYNSSNSLDSGIGSLDHSNVPAPHSTTVSTFLRPAELRNDNTRGRGRGRGSTHITGGVRGGARPSWNNNISSHNEGSFETSDWVNRSGVPSSARSQDGRMQSLASSGNSHDNSIVCRCNNDAILLTVKKDGPNKGRQFYKCGNPQGQGCNYFMWADDLENNPSVVTTRVDNGGNNHNTSATNSAVTNTSWSMQAVNSTEDDETNCECGIPAKRLTVQKDGPNKGRQFFVCIKPQQERCNFFKWADDDTHYNGGGRDNGTWGSTFRGRGGAQRGTKRPAPSSSGPPKKRKCSVCKQEGHTKTNCPNK